MLDISASAQRTASPLPCRTDTHGGDAVGFIAQRRAGSSHALRWALYRADGTLSNSFAASLDRGAVAALLQTTGLALMADDTVAPAHRPSKHEPEIRRAAA